MSELKRYWVWNEKLHSEPKTGFAPYMNENTRDVFLASEAEAALKDSERRVDLINTRATNAEFDLLEVQKTLKAQAEEIARLRSLLVESEKAVQDYINEIYTNGGVEYRGYSSLLDRIRAALEVKS